MRKTKASSDKNVLLVNLPWQKNGSWGVRAGSRWPHIRNITEGGYLPFPFFLAYATSLLRQNDIEANLLDAIAEWMPKDAFMNDLQARNFDILVAETSVPSYYHDMELLEEISSLDIPIVLCGPHGRIEDHDFLRKHEFIEFVLFGEYEFTLLELVKAISAGKMDFSHIEGLMWRDKAKNILKNPRRHPFDINLLPWPHRDTLPMKRYCDLPGDIPQPSVQMVASRGCPFSSCNFCLWPQVIFDGKTYRTRDVIDVANEMEYLVGERGFESVYFDDDTFNSGTDRIVKLCKEIKTRNLHGIPWAVMARADLMNKRLLETLKSAGLHAVKYGIESASQELVDSCGKRLNLKEAEKNIRYTKSLGIRVHLAFSFGLPGETLDTIRRTIDYAIELDPYSVQFSLLTPFPGTTLFKNLDKEGRILTEDWSLYDGNSSMVFRPDNLSASDLETAKLTAYELWDDHQRGKAPISEEREDGFCRHDDPTM